MKIIVYTIMKNELSNIEPWLENIKDADGIYVLDTGSDDGSYEKMLSMREKYPQLVVQQKIYDNFRFDVARNDNLAMVPDEEDTVCWTIDLDERFVKGWYKKTKEVVEAHPKFYKLQYNYAPSHQSDGTPTELLIYDKCHQRKGARWSLPIHEVLTYDIPSPKEYYSDGYVKIPERGAFVHHFQKPNKNREQYISLLEQRERDDPYDIEAINHHINELLKLGKKDEAFSLMLEQYHRGCECNCDWLEIICGNIAETLWRDNNSDAVEIWLRRAIDINPSLRTYYIVLANYLCYGTSKSRPKEAIDLLNKMVENTTPCKTEWKEREGNWSWRAEDAFGVAYSWLGDYRGALRTFKDALAQADTPQAKALCQLHIDFCIKKLGGDIEETYPKRAYVTVLSNNSYINGLVVLNESLKRTKPKYPLYVIITPDVSEENRTVLAQLGLKTIEKQQLVPPDLDKKSGVYYMQSLEQPGWHAALVKLEIFNLTQFEKIVYLDSDLYIRRNIDDLFDKPGWSAVQDMCYFDTRENTDKMFNSGVLVVEPNKETYNGLLDILYHHDFGDQLIHDQLILQIYKKDWNKQTELHLPVWYNIWTTYFRTDEPYFYYPNDVKVLHIIDKKPWVMGKQYFENSKERFYLYALLNLWYIDVLNYTIRDLNSKGIHSSDLKIIN